jgi:antitoxin HicB
MIVGASLVEVWIVEYLLPIEIEPLEEGGYLATSGVLPGFLAQGRSIAETLEIAQDVARKLIESYVEHGDPLPDELQEGTGQAARVEFRIPIPVVR